jgi:hypothetical protein
LAAKGMQGEASAHQIGSHPCSHGGWIRSPPFHPPGPFETRTISMLKALA